ncbi:hypothetical protein BY996DRAFT_6416700 [Phakopsora pachyrhizi]|nr:hypothetical protein BY996DRAFT_6416700 [Phakopsora pachyrhizi]
MIGLIGSFTKWLSEMGSTNFSLIPVDKSSCLASSPLVSLKDEIEIAKLVFKEIWEDDQKSLLSAELWFIILQDIGRIIIPSSDIDHGSSSNRHSEFFSAPLAATHADQVKESADHFRKVLEKYIKLDVQQGLSEVDEEVEGDDNKEVEKETEDEEIMEYDLINGGLKIDTRVLKFRKNIKKKTVRGEADEEQLKIKLEKEYIKKNYRQCVKCRCKSKIIYNKFKNKSENSLIEKNNPNLKSIDFECKSKNEAFKFNSQHLGQFQNEGTGANIAALEEGNSEGFDGWSFSAFDLSAREFERRCICFGAWVSI